jgi:hypothetical protein
MSKSPQALVDQLTAVQWIAIVVVIVLAINGLATLLESLRKIQGFVRDVLAHLKGKRMSDAQLKAQALCVAKRLMDFVQERQAKEPAFKFETFDESSNALIKYSQETQNCYAREFAGQISNLRDELLKRKLQDRELDMFYQHPTNYIGLRMLAMRLAALAEKLRGK